MLETKNYSDETSATGTSPFYLGLFFSAEEAHKAYLDAKRKYHKGCLI